VFAAFEFRLQQFYRAANDATLQLAVFGGRGMSFNICRGTLGSLAMFIAIRNGAAVAVCGQLGRWTDQEEHKRRRD
jgi:hypothetical protein